MTSEAMMREPRSLRVLVACEFSGIVRDAFAARGFDAWSCDIVPAKRNHSVQHIRGDVLDVLGRGWDAMVGHPPCTRLCNSGVCWLDKRNLWSAMRSACAFFLTLWNAPIPHIAIENPIMHGHAMSIIGQEPDQIIQPWQFGHGETKATCLWLKNLPSLVPTSVVSGRAQRLHRLPPSPLRARIRSTTFPGIADAMAHQWGDFILAARKEITT